MFPQTCNRCNRVFFHHDLFVHDDHVECIPCLAESRAYWAARAVAAEKKAAFYKDLYDVSKQLYEIQKNLRGKV